MATGDKALEGEFEDITGFFIEPSPARRRIYWKQSPGYIQVDKTLLLKLDEDGSVVLEAGQAAGIIKAVVKVVDEV